MNTYTHTTQQHDGNQLSYLASSIGNGFDHNVVFLIGGAGKMSTDDLRKVEVIIGELALFARHSGMIVVDGGTDSGIMKMMGVSRNTVGGFKLVGVSPIGCVERGDAKLDAGHDVHVGVIGDEWGNESWSLQTLAKKLAGETGKVVGIMINGGLLTLKEAELAQSLAHDLIVIQGSGRNADVLANVYSGSPLVGDEAPEAVEIARKMLGRADSNSFRWGRIRVCGIADAMDVINTIKSL